MTEEQFRKAQYLLDEIDSKEKIVNHHKNLIEALKKDHYRTTYPIKDQHTKHYDGINEVVTNFSIKVDKKYIVKQLESDLYIAENLLKKYRLEFSKL